MTAKKRLTKTKPKRRSQKAVIEFWCSDQWALSAHTPSAKPIAEVRQYFKKHDMGNRALFDLKYRVRAL